MPAGSQSPHWTRISRVLVSMRTRPVGHASEGNSAVIPGLVPGIQPPANAGASRELDLGDKHRDDGVSAASACSDSIRILDQDGNALSAAGAGRGDAVATLRAPQLARQRQ